METIGKYDVLSTLGRGGMGVVYLARDPVIGRDVAVKMIVDQAVADPSVRRRFLAEAQRAGALNHPNIVTIYDVGEDDGRPFIVMEVMQGSDLRQVMDEAGDLPMADRIDIAVQFARGLGFAHDNGILHRDIKPENVFVVEGGVAKVLDFGIARMESEAETVTQGVIGTPRYMSPEQVRGEAVDRRTDIYSFGMVLYELFGGNHPFIGHSVHTTLHKILNEVPPPVPLPDGAPARLQEIVSRCIEKDPEDRYASLDEAVADLLALDAKGPLPGAARPRRARRGPRTAVLAGAAVAVAVAVVAWVATDAPDDAAPETVVQAEPVGRAAGDTASAASAPADSLLADALDGPAPTPIAPPRAATPPPLPQTAGTVVPSSPPVRRAEPPPTTPSSREPTRSPDPAVPSDPEPGPAAVPDRPPAVETRPLPAARPEAPPPDRSEELRAQAVQTVDRLGRSLAAAMEARDAGALQRVHAFYGQMGPLFNIASDVRATVTTSGVTVSGDRATTTATLAFTYANKTQNNKQESQRIQYAWTLARSGAGWALTDVQVR